MLKMNKEREAFLALELESRGLTSKLVDLTNRRLAVVKHANTLVIGRFEGLTAEFEAWTITKAEELMVQLRDIVIEMSVVRRRVSDKYPDSELAFQLEQEYHRKLQLLETLKCMGEFVAGEDVAFFQSFHNAWRSDSTFGYFDF